MRDKLRRQVIAANHLPECFDRESVIPNFIFTKERPQAMVINAALNQADDVLERLKLACELQVLAEGKCGLVYVEPSERFGEQDATILNNATVAVLSSVGYQDFEIWRWHLQCGDSSQSKAVPTRDFSTNGDRSALCMYLCTAGNGVVDVPKASAKDKPAARMESHSLQTGMCIIYPSDTTYIVHQASAIYLHCVLRPRGSEIEVAVCHAVAYPCPHNKSVVMGDVQAYPRTYKPSALDCSYRGARWANVLDHLKNCKANPTNDKYILSRQKRRERNIRAIKCDQCEHEPFAKMNSYIRHRLRMHPAPSPPSELLAASAQIDTDLTSLIGGDEAMEYLAWLEDVPSDDTPSMQHKRLRQDNRGTNVVDSPPAFGSPPLPSLIEIPLEETPVHGVIEIDRSAMLPLEAEVACQLVTEMLAPITAAEIRQPSGRMEFNASEMSLEGVTAILAAFGEILAGDVFADVGSGVGNVSIQVALQSSFSKSVCVEMRPELTALTESLIKCHGRNEPRLSKLVVVTADVSKIDFVDIPAMTEASHIFSHNTLYCAKTLLKFEDLCWLPRLRSVALTKRPCTRHRDRCLNVFCQTWTLESTIRVPVTYKVALVDVFIFRRADTWSDMLDTTVDC